MRSSSVDWFIGIFRNKQHHNEQTSMKKEITLSVYRWALIALFLTTSAFTETAWAADRTEHKVLSVARGGTLIFETFSGSIDIKTHDSEQIVYDAVLKVNRGWFGRKSADVDDVVFEYETSGTDSKIVVKWNKGFKARFSSINVQHTLLVPAHYNIDVRTAGGGISGDGIGGQVKAKTAGGSIHFNGVTGDIVARTSGGSIRITKVVGDVDVGTAGGSITVSEITGNLKGTTSGGSIRAELDAQIQKPLELSTAGGSVTLSVPGDFQADLNASTSGGSVSCELPIQGTIKRQSINGKVNGGGPEVRLHTSGGSIRVLKR